MRSLPTPKTLAEASVALLGLSAVFLFEMLDNSILNVALPTIGRELHASSAALQWVTGAYAVVFGALLLAFGALSDRFGRRRTMLVGLVLLGFSSFLTAFVTTAEQLVAVRVLTGMAAALTTPGSMALAFRLFEDDSLRVRAINLISTVGIVGLAVGPTVGGLVLAFAPWQVLLLINVPIAALAFFGVLTGVSPDDPAQHHSDPFDAPGAVLGTVTIVLALAAPTLFVVRGGAAWEPWAAGLGALVALVLFVGRERSTSHPLLDLKLVTHPLVASGLAYKAAAGLATAGVGYLVTLELQLDWGWSPALAALGMLPQVLVLLAGAVYVKPFLDWVGMEKAAWISSLAVLAGLAVYTLLGRFGYGWMALALVLVAAGLRVVGVVAATNVMRGLPAHRTTVGAALTDTVTQVASGVGLTVVGTLVAALMPGTLAVPKWDEGQITAFRSAVLMGSSVLTTLCAVLVAAGMLAGRSRRAV